MHRVLQTWARDAAGFAPVLRQQDPSWRSVTFPVAGGRAVLWGAGQYVNRAMAVGIDVPMTDADFEQLESRSEAVGVDAALEISPITRPDVRAAAEHRGYAARGTVSVLRRLLTDVGSLPFGRSWSVEPAADQLAAWQEVSALGWERAAGMARRASDAFGAAAALIDGDGFVLARDVSDRRPVGCASVGTLDGVATLRAMATIPVERGRGVQAALIHHRLRIADAAGCDVAATTTAPGGASERNLRRHGFEPWFEIKVLARPGRRAAG